MTCMCADELANIMWLGHADGRISGHSMGDAPGTALNCQQLYCWQVRPLLRVARLWSLEVPVQARPCFPHQGAVCHRAPCVGI